MTNLEVTIKSLRNKFVTLDCNVFLLLVIGSLGKEHISKFKRTQLFTNKDYDLLVSLIRNSKVLITPNVITEASNLLESYSYEKQKVGLLALKEIIQSIVERYEHSELLSELDSFFYFGLSDSSVDNLCQSGVVAITIDLPLFGYLTSKGISAINFNQ